jgi:hypothetical protein
LSLWKDADPDIPIYQQARAEYSRLQHGVARSNKRSILFTEQHSALLEALLEESAHLAQDG